MLEAALPTLDTLREPVAPRLEAVERRIEAMAAADFGPLNEVSEYLLAASGKMLRPMLLLISNGIGGRPSEEAVRLAAIVELLHVATLVHDDAVDHSPKRRGMPTVNARWSHQVAIIMGDYLYSRAVVEITALNDVEAIHLLAQAANRMTIGEMRQLAAHDALDATPDDYYALCQAKTASLMSAACELGAMFGDPSFRGALRDFGHDLGMAFQITDDLLDYTVSSEITGKPAGLDLREHKVTLPLIAVLSRLSAADRCVVDALFADPSPSDEDVAAVVRIVEAAGGLDVTRRAAADFACRARVHLEALPDEPGPRLLSQAVDYVVERRR
ncbi:MAG: polyprenyl synthetase family protein [Gemmatimonadota bacterium]